MRGTSVFGSFFARVMRKALRHCRERGDEIVVKGGRLFCPTAMFLLVQLLSGEKAPNPHLPIRHNEIRLSEYN